MSRRVKVLLCAETLMLAAAVTYLLILLFGVKLPVSPYYGLVNTDPALTFQAVNPCSGRLRQSVRFEAVNAGGDPYRYDSQFRLEVKQDGAWRVLPRGKWPYESRMSPGYLAPYSESDSIYASWEWLYGELPPGAYRMVKEFVNMATGCTSVAAAEFVIPS